MFHHHFLQKLLKLGRQCTEEDHLLLLLQRRYKLICNQETKAGNQYERSLGKGQIFGGMLFFIYGSGAFRSKLTSVLELGGGQILQRARIVQHEKLGTRVSQIIVVEDINKVPRGVRHSATNLNVPIVSEKWMVESLLHGTLLELPTTSRRCPRRTTTKTSTLPYSYCTRTRTRQRLVNVTTKPSNESTRKPIALKKVVQDSSCHKKNAIEKSFQTCNIDPAFTLVGKGFSFPVEVSLANVRTKQLHDPTHVKHKPINQLYFKVVSYAGVDYSIGDCVEIWQDSRLKICSSIVRIERLWVKKASIQTRASRLALVEQSKQACYMLCRCFYHPQDTSFAGCGSDKEVFVSNNFKRCRSHEERIL
ncbi:hypothetical protein O6H91_16G005100 [Diphasiastrum complanatum]|uniref:Uncharacterized protein n=1 Tax=Diphasiastrum complanatum TaxID=34168 RepID=A0ACC2B9F6_DIPCM|nr:hypothetical protein O6H91_16G005100 [Diphasiastrum complanatum]